MGTSQNAEEGGKYLHPIFSLKESEIINFYNTMGKKIYSLDGHYYTIDDETKKVKEVTISEADVSPEITKKLNDFLTPELFIKHDSYEILTTTAIADKIEEIIKHSEEYCFLITPYFDYWERLKDCLKTASEQKKKIVFFIRDEKYYEVKIRDFYKDYKFDLIFIKNLHAKLYVNEHEGLITSMNLYKHSKEENYEIGVLIKNKYDLNDIINKFIINDVFKTGETYVLEGEYYKLLKNGLFFEKNINYCNKPDDSNIKKVPEEEPNNQLPKNDNISNESNLNETDNDNLKNNDNLSCESNADNDDSINIEHGHCICCHNEIPYNKSSPICKDCSDNKDKKTYTYCHGCGEKSIRSPSYPFCDSCYTEYCSKQKLQHK